MKNATAGAGLAGPVLRRDRLVVAGGLAVLTALAWTYILHMSRAMPAPGAMLRGGQMEMHMSAAGGAPELLWLVPMWIVMMVAMMVPSAAPTILLFAGVARQRRARGVPAASTAVFTLGYLLVWAVYASLAALVQWQLHRLALLAPTMASASPLLGGTLLILAGVYQWLPIKGACLSHCRSPLGFFSHHWREGRGGALLLGMEHGSYCVGCCWALMALLFVAGVMNLLWVFAIGVFVLVERLLPPGRLVGRAAAVLLIGWGIWVITGA
jgi:predicted metal-binding membrane protein